LLADCQSLTAASPKYFIRFHKLTESLPPPDLPPVHSGYWRRDPPCIMTTLHLPGRHPALRPSPAPAPPATPPRTSKRPRKSLVKYILTCLNKHRNGLKPALNEPRSSAERTRNKLLRPSSLPRPACLPSNPLTPGRTTVTITMTSSIIAGLS
jgi:hypothetical protein